MRNGIIVENVLNALAAVATLALIAACVVLWVLATPAQSSAENDLDSVQERGAR